MSDCLKILLVEDSQMDADMISRHLKRENIDFQLSRVWDRDAFIDGINEDDPDIIISDHSIPGFSGMEAYRLLKTINSNIPFIMLTGAVSEKILIEFAREGIDDYILKDNLLRLALSIENVINKKRIEELHKQLENIHKDLKDSINYAKIIQYAMLPHSSLLREVFPNSFILFKPKDILSGDFYWFKRIKNIFFIAVADCTGHGIPGSLLSMMGFNMLHEAVSTKRLDHPAEVLDNLSKQFRRIGRNTSAVINDGMDIACCSINLENHVLSYAGANRPIYIVRRNELIEIKPNRKSVSGVEESGSKFSPHNIDIEQGDRVFLFSDGYADQFHFETNKKLLIKRLRELLLQSSLSRFEEQENIITNYFDNWKGGMEQIDDVLLIGIQIP